MRTAPILTVAALAALGLAAAPASAAVIFQQNFNGATLASITGTGINQFKTISQGTDPTDPSTFAITNDALYAKNGADGSYPSASATGTNLAGGAIGATPFTFSFNAAPIAVPNAGNTGTIVYVTANNLRLRLDLRVETSSGSPAILPRSDGGGQGMSKFTTPTDILIVANPSASTYNYMAPDSSSHSIDPGQWDVWAGPAGHSLGIPMAANSSADNIQLQLPGWSTANGTIALDNLDLSTVEVPEPASLGLLALGGLALLRRRR